MAEKPNRIWIDPARPELKWVAYDFEGAEPYVRAAVAGPRKDAQKFAEKVVGTVFDNTSASHETLKATMIERITDWLSRDTSDSARRAAEEISSTFGLRFQEDSLQRTTAIISKYFAAESRCPHNVPVGYGCHYCPDTVAVAAAPADNDADGEH